MKNNKCFLSYAFTDKEIVINEIIPVLNELNVNFWYDEKDIQFGDNIFETIVQGVKSSDFIVSYFNGRSNYANFELGSAIGQGKPIIAILNDKYSFPSDIRNLNYILYNENNKENFKSKLKRAIEIIQENVIDKLDFLNAYKKKIIGIEIGTDSENFIEELRITADLIQFIKEVSKTDNIEVIETSKGSLKSILSIDFKAWTELIEKMAFFKTELKKRKTENTKIEAETKKIEAETNNIEVETKIKQATAFLDIIERSKKLGLKLQIDDDYLLLNNDNILTIKTPDKQEE